MFRHVLLALPLFVLAACGGSPSTTTTTPSTPVTPTPTVSALTISGNSPAVGESVQFTATATLSNGSTQNVTAQATWQSSNAAVATVSNSGVVRSVAAGEADITATYSGASGSQHVRVAAAIVARTLTGQLTDDSTGRPLIDGAEAQVMDGENAGRVGRADANGSYTIPDLAVGTFTLRARANGYESRDHQTTIDAADVRVDFFLRAQSREVPCTYTVSPDVLWVSMGGLAFDPIQVKTSRPDCAWSATTTNRIYLGISGMSSGLVHAVSGSGTASILFTTNAVPNRDCLRIDTVQVRWNGGGTDVTLKQPIAFPEPPLCK